MLSDSRDGIPSPVVTSSDADLARVLEWLDSHVNHERSGISGLKRSANEPERRLRHLHRFMELMDEPQRQYPSIHITGTNGKTSTARILTSLILASGLTAGTYTSPHLQRVNERISTNGEPISDIDLVEILDAVRLLEPLLGDERPSYFEILTAGAFRYFAEAPVDVGVIEVGVGGQWDATNVIDGTVAVATNVGLDHLDYLGPTRSDVARHKAGIVKRGATLVLGEHDSEVLDHFARREPGTLLIAGRDFEVERTVPAVGGRVVDLRTPGASYSGIFLALHGAFQAANALTALVAAEALFDKPIAPDVVQEAFGAVRSPGRMEVVCRRPLCLLDGAHNRVGAEALISSVNEEFGAQTARVLVVGMLRPHNPAELLTALAASDARLVVACTPSSPRAVPAADIVAAAIDMGVPAVEIDDAGAATREALSSAGESDLVLVTGSLYVVGAARDALKPFSL